MPDVIKVQSELENGFAEMIPAIDEAAKILYKTNPTKAREFITDFSCNSADNTVKRWKELGNFLLVKYLDGNVKHEKNGEFIRNPWGYPQGPMYPGYPEEWKENLINNTDTKFKTP
jgi:hypothetical protein